MSPKGGGGSTPRSGPADKQVTIGEIKAKLQEIRGELDGTVEAAKPAATRIAAGGAVAATALAFLLGRWRGKRKSTWVEIRRQ